MHWYADVDIEQHGWPGTWNPRYLDAMSGDEWSIEEDGLARFRGSGSPFAPPIAWTSPTPIYGNWG